jgi:hypothetical protein
MRRFFCAQRSCTALVGLALFLSAYALAAEERNDHRGSIGLLLSTGGEYKASIAGPVVENGVRLPAHIGATLAIGHNGNELKLQLDSTWLGPEVDLGISFGYRGYFAVDRLKTFFDGDLGIRFLTRFTIGPEVGVGVQYELSPVIGVFARLGGKLGFGQALRLGADLTVGIQLRSYVLE